MQRACDNPRVQEGKAPEVVTRRIPTHSEQVSSHRGDDHMAAACEMIRADHAVYVVDLAKTQRIAWGGFVDACRPDREQVLIVV